MEVQGKIKLIEETQSFGASGFRKRNIVLTTEEQYPQDLALEFIQDKVDLLDKYNVGDTVKIHINLRGREWINPEGVAKYFNSIVGWRIETSTPSNVDEAKEMIDEVLPESNDLPF